LREEPEMQRQRQMDRERRKEKDGEEREDKQFFRIKKIYIKSKKILF
jgi:hypothetical protein